MSPAPPTVTLLRHGETLWSKSGQHTGRTDLELTDVGERQAKAAERLLEGRTFDFVLTSPLQRARRTAELAGLTPYEVVDGLREWDYGKFEGMTTAEIHEEYPDWSVWDGPWVGGETAEEVRVRVDAIVRRVLDLPDGSRVAVVAHGHILRAFGARWIGTDVRGGRWLGLDTAAVCELGWEHDYRVLQRWNLVS